MMARDAAQQERTRQRQFAGGRHREEAPRITIAILM